MKTANTLLQSIIPSLKKAKHPQPKSGITTSYTIVNPKNIIIDPTIQRKVNTLSVQKIINNFDWTKVKTPICISDDTNNIYVVDGQHTLMAILYLFPNVQVTIQLHKFSGTLTPSQRTVFGSNLFLSCNKGIFTPVNKFYTLRAAMIDGDAIACDIFNICNNFGVTLTPNSAKNPRELSHISHAEKAYKEYGKNNFEEAIKFYVSQFPNDIIDGSMLKAIARFFFVYGSQFNTDLQNNINQTTFIKISDSKANGSLHNLSNNSENKVLFMNYYMNKILDVPSNHDIRHAWTIANILQTNGVNINLSLLQ